MEKQRGFVYFIRHGESKWNVEDKICGATDVPLTEKGHEQAILTGKKFLEMGYHADLILYSPLERAAETARHISEITGIPMRVEPRLIEQNFGIWEGTSPRNNPGFFEAKQHFINSFGTGESMFRVAQRVYNLLDELREDERTYVIVAHNGIVRFVKSYFSDMKNGEFAAFKVGNGEICRFDF
ncbi:MAG: histidine phosphatase family protein [Eubacteriales bacterium]|nr:histidine phosphatase family protein [Eubacteriales bacterium]